eukprot:951317-Amphidinium_carterae.1
MIVSRTAAVGKQAPGAALSLAHQLLGLHPELAEPRDTLSILPKRLFHVQRHHSNMDVKHETH